MDEKTAIEYLDQFLKGFHRAGLTPIDGWDRTSRKPMPWSELSNFLDDLSQQLPESGSFRPGVE